MNPSSPAFRTFLPGVINQAIINGTSPSGPAPWTPTQLPNIALMWEGAMATLTSGKVSSVTNQGLLGSAQNMV